MSFDTGTLALALLCLCAFQQIFFMRQVQKLVDKAMSRSFSEYQSAAKPTERPKLAPVHEAPEDLRVMNEFNL